MTTAKSSYFLASDITVKLYPALFILQTLSFMMFVIPLNVKLVQ